MDKIKDLIVAEAFYSIQGEGMTVGRPAIFIRLAGCNLLCGGKGTDKDGLLHNGATWRCDTIEVWQKGKSISDAELITEMNNRFDFLNLLRNEVRIIFTGGEPMLQQDSIMNFLNYLEDEFGLQPYVEVETNGTIWPHATFAKHVNLFNISPKLSNSGEETKKRFTGAFDSYANFNSQYKFVISNETDMKEVIAIIENYSINLDLVWLMPAASDRETLHEVSKRVIEYAKNYQLNYSHRLHIEIWNKRTGV